MVLEVVGVIHPSPSPPTTILWEPCLLFLGNNTTIHTCKYCGFVFNPSPLQALQDHVVFATFPTILVNNYM